MKITNTYLITSIVILPNIVWSIGQETDENINEILKRLERVETYCNGMEKENERTSGQSKSSLEETVDELVKRISYLEEKLSDFESIKRSTGKQKSVVSTY